MLFIEESNNVADYFIFENLWRAGGGGVVVVLLAVLLYLVLVKNGVDSTSSPPS